MISKNTDVDFLIIIIVSIGIILLFITTVISLIYLSYRRYMRYQYEKQALKQNYEEEKLKAKIEIQEQTFAFLSGEIHDNIGQSLSLAKLNLNMGSATQVQQAKDILTTVIQDLRTLAQNLNIENIKNRDLITLIKNEVSRLHQTQAYHVEFLLSATEEELMVDNQILIFRIFQEAINNIIKHASAKNITIKLSINKEDFTLEIIDNGVGFDTNTSYQGIGLTSIKKRADLIGAQIEIKSILEKGSHLTLRIDRPKKRLDEDYTL